MKNYPEDFPWREFIKEAIPLAVVLVAYFAIQYAISAESIAWCLADGSASAGQTEVTK